VGVGDSEIVAAISIWDIRQTYGIAAGGIEGYDF